MILPAEGKFRAILKMKTASNNEKLMILIKFILSALKPEMKLFIERETSATCKSSNKRLPVASLNEDNFPPLGSFSFFSLVDANKASLTSCVTGRGTDLIKERKKNIIMQWHQVALTQEHLFSILSRTRFQRIL